jgi:ribonuclease P protein component
MKAGSGVFRPEYRLHQPSEYSAVLASPLRVRSRHFEIRYRAADGASPRLGLIVPKRLAKRAVVRNTVKRLSREAFRTVRERLACVDLVVRLSVRVDPGDRLGLDIKRQWREELDQLMLRLKP